MIPQFVVLHWGGLVLWSAQEGLGVEGTPINELVRFLVEGRDTKDRKHLDLEKVQVHWLQDNKCKLIFAAVTFRARPIPYVGEVLKAVKKGFKKFYGVERLAHPWDHDFSDFQEQYEALLEPIETQHFRNPRLHASQGPTATPHRASDGATPGDQQDQGGAAPKKLSLMERKRLEMKKLLEQEWGEGKEVEEERDESSGAISLASGSSGDDLDGRGGSTSPDRAQKKLDLLRKQSQSGGSGSRRVAKGKKSVTSPLRSSPGSSSGDLKRDTSKSLRSWKEDSISEEAMRAFDKSGEMLTEEERRQADIRKAEQYGAAVPKPEDFQSSSDEEIFSSEEEEEDEDGEEGESSNASSASGQAGKRPSFWGRMFGADGSSSDPKQKKKKKNSGFFSFVTNLIGSQELDHESLAPVMKSFREKLMTKNVASEIADRMCQSVEESLLGHKLGTFQRKATVVRNAMIDACKRILTPQVDMNILREISRAKEEGRPYSIVFVGVNGVGKSTSLAKVCYWLMRQKLQCQITACDTFRSGAVEQLRVHADKLCVPLFESGYGKDPSAIARAGIAKAAADGKDVVLIDTAGRMQDNEPLMTALVKLLHANNPDLIVFVGEALVGNDAVDQLTKFNQALRDLTPVGKRPRVIDGIVLTKYDTVDDKVGAAISMVHTTGQPILFVGVGQTYTDLRVLNVNRIVKDLMR